MLQMLCNLGPLHHHHHHISIVNHMHAYDTQVAGPFEHDDRELTEILQMLCNLGPLHHHHNRISIVNHTHAYDTQVADPFEHDDGELTEMLQMLCHPGPLHYHHHISIMNYMQAWDATLTVNAAEVIFQRSRMSRLLIGQVASGIDMQM